MDEMATQPALTRRGGRWDSASVYAGCCAREEQAWQLVLAKALSVTSKSQWRLDPADASDLAQQSVLRVFERIDSVADPIAFEAFVRRVTERIVLTFLTSASRRHERVRLDDDRDEGASPPPEPFVDPEPILFAKVELRRMGTLFERVPSDCGAKIRVWLDWKELGGYKNEGEAAAVFDQSLGTFSARVSRCLDLLRSVVQEEVAR